MSEHEPAPKKPAAPKRQMPLPLPDQYAERAIYVERDTELCRRFARNAALLADRPVEVVNATAEAFVDSFTGTATFFVDPARRDDVRNVLFWHGSGAELCWIRCRCLDNNLLPRGQSVSLSVY